MTDMISNQPSAPAIIPVQPHKEAGHWLATVIVAIAVAVVVGGGVYWYITQAAKNAQQTLEQNMVQLQDQNRQLAESLSTKEQTVQQLTADKTALENAAPDIYKDWQTYIPGTADMPFAFTLRYPKSWTANEQTTSANKSANGKNTRCANFSGADVPGAGQNDGKSLLLCFRAVTDNTSTTWTISNIVDAELAKVGIAIPFGGRTLTQKTLFGTSKSINTIIYAQNVRDDETKFPARVKAGDFYFSAVATGTSITPEQQVIFDQILGSLAFTPAPAAPVTAQ